MTSLFPRMELTKFYDNFMTLFKAECFNSKRLTLRDLITQLKRQTDPTHGQTEANRTKLQACACLCMPCNRIAHITHHYRKTTVLCCHRCLISNEFEKNELRLNLDQNFEHQMSLSKSKCWYSNKFTFFFKLRSSIDNW